MADRSQSPLDNTHVALGLGFIETGFADPVGQTLQDHERYHYKRVGVLIFCWEEDDLGVAKEIELLRRVFSTAYNFPDCRVIKIPSVDSHSFTGDVLATAKRTYSSPESLLIVYYGGHGGVDKQRNLYWSAYRYAN